MATNERSTVPIDHSKFLWALKLKISSTRSAPFDFNSQQDAAEILQVVFDELKGSSIRADDLLSNTLSTIVTYNSCFCSTVREEKLDIVSVLWRNFFRLSCWNKESIKDTSFIQSALILVIHLKRFHIEHDKVSKDNQFFKCFPEDSLQIRITDSNEVSFFNNFSLVARINHSGSLNNGHYWAIIKDNTTSQWFSCNDKVVFEIKADDLDNKTSYMLFYVRKWFSFYFIFISVFFLMQGGFANSDTVFGCDNLTHNPSSVQILSLVTQFSGLTTLQSLVLEALQGAWPNLVLSLTTEDLTYNHIFVCFCCFFSKYELCKAALSCLILSLGVKTPHITPVLYGNSVCSLNFQA